MNQKNQGLTLVEVVIALILFSIVVVFTLPVFLSANKLNTQTDTRLYAQNVGQESMELWLQEASNTTKESFKPSPEDNLLVGFSLCSSHVCVREKHFLLKPNVYFINMLNPLMYSFKWIMNLLWMMSIPMHLHLMFMRGMYSCFKVRIG